MLDWTHIQTFLAVAETGSLSAAARDLGLSQPTVGRQVHAAEDALGVELFHRRSHGLDLTLSGETLLEPAKEMQKAAAKLSLIAEGRGVGLNPSNKRPQAERHCLAFAWECSYCLMKATRWGSTRGWD